MIHPLIAGYNTGCSTIGRIETQCSHNTWKKKDVKSGQRDILNSVHLKAPVFTLLKSPVQKLFPSIDVIEILIHCLDILPFSCKIFNSLMKQCLSVR